MKIRIKSNFFVPGFEETDTIELDRQDVSLREFLHFLTAAAPKPIEYVKPGADILDPDDWEIDVNGVPYQNREGRLDTPLTDGDEVTIRIMAMGGG